ncbi:MAG: beta-glucosidase, partial [Phycisphaerae bacterium]|nr:beta-glucosidase [Phycisphaerae bacterium]
RYPEAFLKGVPEETMGIQDGDMERMQAPLDFLGINLYTRSLVEEDLKDAYGIGAKPVEPQGDRAGPRTDFGWEVWPSALRDMVLRITRDYDRPVIEITENGCSYGDGPGASGRIPDTRRIEFHRGFLQALHQAIEDGADVRSYHAWSLLDNFEWAEGYSQRFGLTWVDFETGERTLKDSGLWYGQVAQENGFEAR